MKRNVRPLDEIDMIAQLSKLKEIDYQNTLVLSALIELLIEKRILTRKEIEQKTNELEVDLTLDLISSSVSSTSDKH